MKIKERQAAILDYLQEKGQAVVDELANLFQTTGATIRKDLTQLENSHLIIRTYGGAILNKEIGDQPIDSKTFINTIRKRRIAQEAAKLINIGDSVIFDSGSTVGQMIPALSKIDNLTIMTNSLNMVNELASNNNNQTIILSGGTFRRKSASFHSNEIITKLSYEYYSFDKLFMGADGIDFNGGVTTFNESYQGSVAMCKAASKVVLLADSSKFGRRGPNVVSNLENIDIIITDNGLDPKYYDGLSKLGINVIMVSSED